MTANTACDEPREYELRVGGHLGDHWADWFGELALARESDGTTTLRGRVADQAALHGTLIKIRDLGMVLLSVRAIDDDHVLPPVRSERSASTGEPELTVSPSGPVRRRARPAPRHGGRPPGGW